LRDRRILTLANQLLPTMSFAPDGRLLSPGEVYEAPSLTKEEEEWREDLNVTMMCPGEIDFQALVVTPVSNAACRLPRDASKPRRGIQLWRHGLWQLWPSPGRARHRHQE
jgi:hypothetical protein